MRQEQDQKLYIIIITKNIKQQQEEYTKNLIKENKIVDKKSGKQRKANTILVVKNLDLSLGNKIILNNPGTSNAFVV